MSFKNYKKALMRFMESVIRAVCPISAKKVVFQSFFGNGYSCNPRYISETLQREGGAEIVWIARNPGSKEFSPGARVVKASSPAALYHNATASVIVDNSRRIGSWTKRCGQTYIQTWHGTPLKRIEGDCTDMLPPPYIEGAKRDSGMCDCILSGNRHSTEVIKRAFWFNGRILECGTPRNDILFRTDPGRIDVIKGILGIVEGVRIALYAPTFRSDSAGAKWGAGAGFDVDSLRNALSKRFGGEWIILLRYHPNVANTLKGRDGNNGSPWIIDATHYSDMAELLLVSDFLLTDYSSSMFDFSLTGKPCFLLTPDEDDYRDSERGFYFDLDALPFHRGRNMDNLVEMITAHDDHDYAKRVEGFLDLIGNFEDGNAAKVVVGVILDKIRTM